MADDMLRPTMEAPPRWQTAHKDPPELKHTVIDIRQLNIDQPPHSPGTQILSEHTHHRHDRLGRSPAVGHQSAVGESGVGVKHIPLYIARHDCREATCATEYDRRVGKPSGVIVHIAAVEQKSAVFDRATKSFHSAAISGA